MIWDERMQEGREFRIVSAGKRNEREPKDRLLRETWKLAKQDNRNLWAEYWTTPCTAVVGLLPLSFRPFTTLHTATSLSIFQSSVKRDEFPLRPCRQAEKLTDQ